MNRILAPFPLVRLLLPFAAGVFLGTQTGTSYIQWWITASLAFIAFLFTFRKDLLSFMQYQFSAVPVYLCLFFTGAALPLSIKEHRINEAEKVKDGQQVMVRIISDPERNKRSVKCTGRIFLTIAEGKWASCDSKTVLYFPVDDRSASLRYGDEIFLRKGVQPVRNRGNPGEFNYTGWLHNKGIWFTAYTGNNWFKISHSPENVLLEIAINCRHFFLSKLESSGLKGQELAVAGALLLGDDSEIDPELMKAYSASGTLHVLSVSGMHVALIFVVLLKLLSPLEKQKRLRWISFTLQYGVIWFYAFLTGLSPSVLRSVTLLSVIITGRMMNRSGYLLNTLSVSAFILLLFDPFLILDAGFQLSYAAVAGIILVQPLLETRCRPSSFLTRHVWSLISVTIAAQVFTFPLGLYYFQQFPTWFLLSNLIIIPLSTVCLYGGLILLLLTPFPVLMEVLSSCYAYLLKALNFSVESTGMLPVPVLRTQSWDIVETVLLFLFLVSVIIWISFRKSRVLFTSLTLLMLLTLAIADNRKNDLISQELVVFNSSKGWAIAHRSGDKMYVIADSGFISSGQVNRIIQNWTKMYSVYAPFPGVETQNLVVKERSPSDFDVRMPEQTFFTGTHSQLINTDVKYDHLIVSRKNRRQADELIQLRKFGSVIITEETGYYWTRYWKRLARENSIPITDLKENGAFIVKQ